MIGSRNNMLSLGIAVLLLAAPSAPGQTRGEEMEAGADFDVAPPTPGLEVQAIIDWVGLNGDYDHHAPFPQPAPPLPADLVRIIAETSSGIYSVSLGGGDYCIVEWWSENVWLEFSDGSGYSFDTRSEVRICNTGAIEWVDRVCDSTWRDTPVPDRYFRARDYRGSQLGIWKKKIYKVPAAQTLDLSALSVPIGGPGWDEVEITVGPGGVLDLTGNPAAGGPVIVAGGLALLRCDTVLMDPGVVLSALVVPAPTVGPGVIVGGPDIRARGFFAIPSSGPAFMPVHVRNGGNGPDTITVSWTGDQGWCLPGQTQVTLNPASAETVTIPLVIPPGTPPSALATVTVQAVSALTPALPTQQTLVVSHAPVGVHPYGEETPGCAGAHGFTATGDARIGNAGFGVACTGAPAFGFGYWAVTLDPSPVLVDPGIGVPIYVDVLHPTSVIVPVQADAAGQLTLPIPIPPDPFLIGLKASTQILWTWPAPCPASGTSFSATTALRVVFQT